MGSLISVVIPIYKIEKYIKQCVNSVLNQKYKNIEVILVDDGSTDKSGEICDGYGKTDSRIKVVHKENGGLSSARNAGLDIANGEYIAFIDGDDYFIDENCFNDIAEQIKISNPDIVLIPMIKYYEDINKYVYRDKKYSSEMIRNKNKDEALSYALKHDFFKACACDKIVKSALIKKNNIRFPEGRFSEDIDWTANLLKNAVSFDCVERPLYVYRQRNASITQNLSYKNVIDIYVQIVKWLPYAVENGDNIMKGYLAHNYVMLLETYGKVSDKKKKSLKKLIIGLSCLLNYDYSINVKKVKYVYKILGINLTLLILRVYRG